MLEFELLARNVFSISEILNRSELSSGLTEKIYWNKIGFTPKQACFVISDTRIFCEKLEEVSAREGIFITAKFMFDYQGFLYLFIRIKGFRQPAVFNRITKEEKRQAQG